MIAKNGRGLEMIKARSKSLFEVNRANKDWITTNPAKEVSF
jgi:hypothetical protein